MIFWLQSKEPLAGMVFTRPATEFLHTEVRNGKNALTIVIKLPKSILYSLSSGGCR